MQTKTNKPTHEEIASAAYRVYLVRDAVGGHEMEDWLRAEQIFIEEAKRPTSESSPVTSHDFHAAPVEQNILRPYEANHPNPRDQRRSPDRTDIRRKTSPFRPAAR